MNWSMVTSSLLCLPVEPCLLADDVLSNLEELVHPAEDLRIPSFVIRCEDVFCFLTEAV